MFVVSVGGRSSLLSVVRCRLSTGMSGVAVGGCCFLVVEVSGVGCLCRLTLIFSFVGDQLWILGTCKLNFFFKI